MIPPPPMSLRHGAVELQFWELTPPDPAHGVVPSHRYKILAPGGECAGRISLRLADSDHVLHASGHLGYEVDPAWRGRGFAYQACLALAPHAREVRRRHLITVDPDNVASIRTVEKLSVERVGEFPVPPGDLQYLRGSRTKLHYWWTP